MDEDEVENLTPADLIRTRLQHIEEVNTILQVHNVRKGNAFGSYSCVGWNGSGEGKWW